MEIKYSENVKLTVNVTEQMIQDFKGCKELAKVPGGSGKECETCSMNVIVNKYDDTALCQLDGVYEEMMKEGDKMNCTECNKSKTDLQTGDQYCEEKGCLVGQQECPETDRKKIRLEKCPFCGSEEVKFVSDTGNTQEYLEYEDQLEYAVYPYIHCQGCGMEFYAEDDNKLIEAWNRRAGDKA